MLGSIDPSCQSINMSGGRRGWWSGNKVNVSSLYLGWGYINAGMLPEGTQG